MTIIHFEQAGSTAIATTSAGMAWSLGYGDGERISVEEMVHACERIGRVVAVPVSADIERGFGKTPEDVANTVRALLEVGVVGFNIEDGVAPGTTTLVAPGILADRISAIRAVAESTGVQLFINARVDTYCVAAADADERLDETLRRALSYVKAGADGIFVPGLKRLDEVRRIASKVPKPLNFYAGFERPPSIAALQAAGVRRVSLGCGPVQAVLAHARRIALEAVNEGTFGTMSAHMLAYGEVNALFPSG